MRVCCTALVPNGGVVEGDQSASVPLPAQSVSQRIRPPSTVTASNTLKSHARDLCYVTRGLSQNLHLNAVLRSANA